MYPFLPSPPENGHKIKFTKHHDGLPEGGRRGRASASSFILRKHHQREMTLGKKEKEKSPTGDGTPEITVFDRTVCTTKLTMAWNAREQDCDPCFAVQRSSYLEASSKFR